MDRLIVELLEDGRRARLLEPFHVVLFDGSTVRVPAGFETDFASVPRFFWRIVPPWGRYARAAVAHDYLYRQEIGTKRRADKAFLYLMERLGVPGWKRRAMYWAVRMFGGRAWKGQETTLGGGFKAS